MTKHWREARLELARDQALDAINIGLGLYTPVNGFMGPEDLESVLEHGRTAAGSPIGLPLLLDAKSDALFVRKPDRLVLVCDKLEVAHIDNPQFFEWRDPKGVQRLFGTESPEHPGVSRYNTFSGYFVAGQVVPKQDSAFVEQIALTSPEAIRRKVISRGWDTIVGFQTRNVPHRAHEQLIRTSLEIFDGVLVQPLVGPRKRGDFTEEAIERSYAYLLNEVFPVSRVMFSFLHARMNYGGPREAVLHAVMRRNFGCTHFIVGRDHAGVSDFYPEYAAQEYCASFGDDLGIQILNMSGPFFCSVCDTMVSAKSCRHSGEKSLVTKISGTQVRAALVSGDLISSNVARPEVLAAASKGKLFI